MKYCKTCGAELLDEAVICPKCGSSVVDGPVTLKKNSMAIAGFVLGIVAMIFNFYAIPAVIGLVLSIVGLIQVYKSGYNHKKLAIAGIVLSAIALVYDIVYYVAIAPLMEEMLNDLLGML